MSTGHVLAEWVPLSGAHARKPVAASWRARPSSGGGVFDLVVLTVGGMELIHTTEPADPVRWLDTDIYTHWLEGYPEPVKP